jgi:hypothetical protein
MEQGFVMDRGHYSTPNEQQWIEGDPVKSFWHGLQTKGREKLPVRTFRCERCGYLESYAQPE